MSQLDFGEIVGSYSVASGNVFSVLTLSFGGQVDIAERG